jgi:hypothetical protein
MDAVGRLFLLPWLQLQVLRLPMLSAQVELLELVQAEQEEQAVRQLLQVQLPQLVESVLLVTIQISQG